LVFPAAHHFTGPENRRPRHQAGYSHGQMAGRSVAAGAERLADPVRRHEAALAVLGPRLEELEVLRIAVARVSDAAARLDAAALPDDASASKAMLVAERGARLDPAEEVARLTAIVDAFKRAMFGRRSEKLDPGQRELALEDAEQEIAEDRTGQDAADAALKRARGQRRRANRGALPKHLPRVERVIEPESLDCPCCGDGLHRIGEDVSERLDVIPGPVPGARHPPAEIRLPGLHRGRLAGARTGPAGQ
jgi:Transposase C of IS166 homeodomain/zinc-finger binding domain of transposase IS66